MPEILHPSALPFYFRAIVFGVIMTAIVFLTRQFIVYDTDLFLIIIWIISILFSIANWIKNRFISIEISESELIYKTGIINTKSVMVPYRQITNINISRTLFGRVFGLGTLSLDTASENQEGDIRIENLHYAQLEQLLLKTKGKFIAKK